MEETAPFFLTPDTNAVRYARWAVDRHKADPEEYRRWSEECRMAALDPTPLSPEERAWHEWNVQGRGNGR